MIKFPKHIERIMKPPVVELFNLIQNKEELISFGQGTPFFSPNRDLMDKFWIEVKHEPNIHQYSPDPGFLSVRKEIAKYLAIQYQSNSLSWENIILTSGANTAFFILISLITEPNDEVILLTPYYFNHMMALQILHVIPVEVKTNENYQPLIDLIVKKITSKTKAIVVISPNNPTGAVFEESTIEGMLEICERYNLILICDETYSEFVYEEDQIIKSYYKSSHPLLIRIGSFSKIFGIPGWRIGYIVLPEEIIPNFMKIQDTVTIAPPTLSQLLVKFLLKEEVNLIAQYRNELLESRQTMLQLLEESEYFQVVSTTGAFYFFAKVPFDGMNFASKLATKSNIVVLPGSVFGKNYRNYIRFSYASMNKHQIEYGFQMITKFIDTQI
ncbi:MAG: pyridoxal phosphate-dependent aminotransferase [Candidatus Hodarchaeota archaeon]